MDNKKIIELDVRPILESGTDPFNDIMNKLKEISDEETLLVINTFEPIPLLNLLKTKGYKYKVERPEPGIVHAYLSKSEIKSKNPAQSINENDIELDFETIEKRFAGKLKEIDVRDLEMPMPMVTILETLEQLNDSEALYVHHKRLPQYLLPELENRNYKLVEKEIDSENIKLIIFK
jgi:uncharacterized protein (DUF2249 family)